MEKFNLEKELVTVVKKINRNLIEGASLDALVFVRSVLDSKNKKSLKDVGEIISTMTNIAHKLDKEIALDILDNFYDDLCDVIDSKRQTLKCCAETKEKDEEFDDNVNKDSDTEPINLKDEAEKIADHFKGLGFEVEVKIERVKKK